MKHKAEYLTAILQFFLLAVSFITKDSFIKSQDVTATFLSIYSTIFAVNVALWALFSGVLDKSYMGISYTEYFFSMRPRIYKQKRVVLASLIILLIACVCHLYGWYDFVGASLFFEILSIAASTMFLYGIFGKPKFILGNRQRRI